MTFGHGLVVVMGADFVAMVSGQFVTPDKMLRKHNIYRCMHGVPLLQWSTELAVESQNWANRQQAKADHGCVDPHAGGFWPDSSDCRLGQNWWSHTGGDVEDLVVAIDSWYNESKQTDGGLVPEWNKAVGHYTQMVWQSNTHVGCGVWSGLDNDGNKEVIVYCNYGPHGNVIGGFGKEVLALNGKSLEQCASEVDSQLDSSQPKPVTIGYKPLHLATLEQSGGCIIEQYKLVFKSGLALVGIDSDGNPCSAEFSKSDVDHKWAWSERGLFTSNVGDKSCLTLNGGNKLEAASDKTCASNNLILPPSGGGWHFNQIGAIPDSINLCMPDVPDALGGAQVVHELPALGPQHCPSDTTTSWHMEVFNNLESSEKSKSARESCSTCWDRIGNFACATDKGCVLAPTDKDCTANGGDWCSEPVSPTTTTTKSVSPAACELHPKCTMLVGNCCPTDSGDRLNCCDEALFTLV
jgi:hypothetical protein